MKQMSIYLKSLIVLFCIFSMIGCSNGKIQYNYNSTDCMNINDPQQRPDTMTVFADFDKKVIDLKKKYKDIFDKTKSVTLSNNSKSKIIRFTIKIETIKNASNIHSAETELIKLNPGEESNLGCSQSLSFIVNDQGDSFRTDTLDLTEYKYSIVGEVILKK